jgi:hypothetical protein
MKNCAVQSPNSSANCTHKLSIREKEMENSLGKRILHAICGVVVGLFIGFVGASKYYKEDTLLISICASAFFAILAFFATDHFWESLGNHFWRR